MKKNLAELGIYLALTFLLLWPLPLLFTSAIPGDGFDGWQNYWNLWWVSKALLEEHTSPFFTRYLYYPNGVSLLFHTLNVPNGLIAMPFQTLFGTTAAYNFIVLISSALSGYGAFLLAREVTRSHRAAFIGGIIYAFSPFRFAHLLGHMQVFSTQWLPLFILTLFRAKRGGSILLPALFLTLSSLSDWYQALYLALFTICYLGWLAWNKGLSSKVILRIGAVWGLGILALSPLLIPMALEMLRYRFMFAPPEHALMLSADLLAFFIPSEFHPLWGKWAGRIAGNFTAPLSERTVFPGYIPLALTLLAWRKYKAKISLWLITFLLFFVLALGPCLHVMGNTLALPLPYALLRHIPIVAMARSVSRFTLMVTLSLGVMAALGAKGVKRYFFPALVFLVLLEYWPYPYPFSPPDTPDFYLKLAQEPGEFAIINLPMNWDRPRYLLYQTVHRKRLVSGYISRVDPRTVAERMPVLQHFRRLGEDVIKADLARITPSVMAYLGVKYAVLDFYQMPGGEEREKTITLAREAFKDSQIIHQDERLIVYRIPVPQEEVPFLFLGEGWGNFNGAYRPVTRKAYLFLHAPSPATAHLLIEARATSGGILKVKADLLSWSFEVPPGQPAFIALPVFAERGDNLLEFEWEPAFRGEPLKVLSLSLGD